MKSCSSAASKDARNPAVTPAGLSRGADLPTVSRAAGLAREQQVIDHQEDDRTHYGDQEAVQVQAGDPRHTEGPEQPATEHRADDTEQDVPDEPFARLVDDLAGDEAGDETQNDPRYEGHETSSAAVGLLICDVEGNAASSRILQLGRA